MPLSLFPYMSLGVLALLALAGASYCFADTPARQDSSTETVYVGLPDPVRTGGVGLNDAIDSRRSVRDFSARPVSVDQLSQLLWAAAGITEKERGLRAVPSAGALYPLEVYVFVSRVDADLMPGIYRYQPKEHRLKSVDISNDLLPALARAALGQDSVRQSAITLVVTAVPGRLMPRYGERSLRYATLEAGHVGQNVSLKALASGLATVMVGAFNDNQVAQLLGLDMDSEIPLYIMPIGHPK